MMAPRVLPLMSTRY